MKRYLFLNPTTIVAFMLFNFISLIMPILGVAFLSGFAKLYTVISWIILFVISLYISFATVIEIDENGIRFSTPFRENRIKWEDVKEVGMTYYAPSSLANSAKFIYFSTKKGYSKLIAKYEINDEFIMLRYRKKLLKDISKYWDGTIEGM